MELAGRRRGGAVAAFATLLVLWLGTACGLRLLPAAQRARQQISLRQAENGSGGGGGGVGFGSGSKLPRPKIITPSVGSTNTQLEKFLMMYTCKICQQRNAQMVSKVAYNHGMVVSTCKQCKSKHLIADNEGKLDMAEYGKKIEDYLVNTRGESVQRISITPQDLEKNYLVDCDGVVTLVSKDAGQLDPGLGTVIDLPTPNSPINRPPPTQDSGGGGFKTERVL